MASDKADGSGTPLLKTCSELGGNPNAGTVNRTLNASTRSSPRHFLFLMRHPIFLFGANPPGDNLEFDLILSIDINHFSHSQSVGKITLGRYAFA
jgi:hypothetical protein